jgi:hypothetical protein
MRRLDRLRRAFLLLLGAIAVSSPGAPPRASSAAPLGARPRLDLPPVEITPEVAAFYRARGFRPVWIEHGALRPEARRLLGRAPDPRVEAALAAGDDADPHALARVDMLLTRAYLALAPGLTAPPAHARMRYIDPGLAPHAWTASEALAALAEASPAAALRRNPAYDGLVRGLAAYRARWSSLPQMPVTAADLRTLRRRVGLPPEGGPDATLATRLRDFQSVHGLPLTGRPDAATIAALNRGAAWYERLILANIERARAIPAAPGDRYVLVDTASARLWMIEDGEIRGTMRVIVGKPAMPTPEMAGLIRHAVLNPYWNVPPDLIRKRAQGAVRRGPGAISGERLQVLTDWSPAARPLQPRQVDWRAVAAGRRYVQVRQLPGPDNMMGRIKFMMPNDLGVYLHDTPLRHLFAGADRRQSSGCIRLEDAMALGRWLFRGPVPAPSGAPEQRVDLPAPVPVYITYLTALPVHGGVVFRPDFYNRDGALLAGLR